MFKKVLLSSLLSLSVVAFGGVSNVKVSAEASPIESLICFSACQGKQLIDKGVKTFDENVKNDPQKYLSIANNLAKEKIMVIFELLEDVGAKGIENLKDNYTKAFVNVFTSTINFLGNNTDTLRNGLQMFYNYLCPNIKCLDLNMQAESAEDTTQSQVVETVAKEGNDL